MEGFNKFKKQINEANLGKTEKEIIIAHLEDMCKDDEYDNLCLKETKNWSKCWMFIYKKARERAVNNCACINDTEVLAWIDEYLGSEDVPEKETSKSKTTPKSTKKRSTTKATTKKTSTKKATKTVVPAADDEEDIDFFAGVEEIDFFEL